MSWQLDVRVGAEMLGGIEHGHLRVGARHYGLCSQQALPVPFGLINAGPNGIVYGYVTGAGSYHVTISDGPTPLGTTYTDAFFFIAALPRSACSYHALSVTAVSTPIRGLPPNIARSLDENATRLTTTMRFGDCRPHALVTAIAAQGEVRGRSPNAPLAEIPVQVRLVAPAGSHSRATGTARVLTQDGQRGIALLAVRLSPARYSIRVVSPQGRAATLAEVKVKDGELAGGYALPSTARSGSRIVIAKQVRGRLDARGTVVLHATIP